MRFHSKPNRNRFKFSRNANTWDRVWDVQPAFAKCDTGRRRELFDVVSIAKDAPIIGRIRLSFRRRLGSFRKPMIFPLA